MNFRIPLGDWADAFVGWLTTALDGVFDVLGAVLRGSYDVVFPVLSAPPFWVVALILAVLAHLAKGWRLALGSLVGFAVIYGVDQWDNAMASLALVLVASVIALLVAIAVGIWAARNARVSAAVRPVLDFMQTMPAFVYLIPAVMFFGIGLVPGVVATFVFAIPPLVRLVNLGIRQVPKDLIEAADAFGSTRWQKLVKVQMPVALPTVMAGVNQSIMLNLSMVVIAGMIGARGLGAEVLRGIQRINVGQGFEAGLAVVILAIVLDRVTASFGKAPGAKTG